MSTIIRESPTRAGTGEFDMAPVAGGFMISSFFDVFTELSLDGGQSWAAQTNGPTRMEGLPEPATLSLLALGGLAMLRRRQ
jgi:hypothetical protein